MEYLGLFWIACVISIGITGIIILVVYWYIKKRKLK